MESVSAISNSSADDGSADDFDYPIIWVFTKWYEDETPPGTILRNAHFVIAHSGFFFFNFVNIWCILLFHGWVLRRLSHNFLMKVALLACIGQMMSCLCSIHRYNTNDEFGYWAHVSVLTGLVGYSFFNYVILHVFLNANRKASIYGIGYKTLGIAFWIAMAIACWVIGSERWEEDNFKHFRSYISGSTAFQLLSYISVLRAVCKGTVSLKQDVEVSMDVVKRVLVAAIGLILFAIACAFSGCPIFQYPATGMTFSVMVVVVAVVGEMDFMDDDHEDVIPQKVSSDDEAKLLFLESAVPMSPASPIHRKRTN